MNGKSSETKGRVITLITLVLAGILLVVSTCSLPESVSARRNYFQSTAGNIMFDHDAHAASTEDCSTCHHSLVSLGELVTCLDCHDDIESGADFEHEDLVEIHEDDCSNCHTFADPSQASNCRTCHPGESQKQERTYCSDCHDDMLDCSDEAVECTDEERLISQTPHPELVAIHDQDCSFCHSAQSVNHAYHQQCIDCHRSRQIGTLSEEEPACGSCHLSR